MEIYLLGTPGSKLIFKMITGGNLLLETRNSRQTIFDMIKGGAGVGGINDVMHWSQEDLYTCFLHFMYDNKATSSILVKLTSLNQ